MPDPQTLVIPIACTLSDPERARRTAALETETFAAVLETTELPDGYAFRFPAETAWLTRLVAFIAEERYCCPFFTFELVCEPAEGPIWLRLRGREGVKAFIAEQFLGRVAGGPRTGVTSETSAPVDDYLQTDYVVIHDRVEITVRIGEFNAELERLLAEIGASSGIFITGWNPFSREKPPEANTAANEWMAALFAGRGIRVLPHVGRSPEGNWFEEGFFALDLDPEDALAIARDFSQHAIVYAPAGAPAQLLLTGAQWTTSPPTG